MQGRAYQQKGPGSKYKDAGKVPHAHRLRYELSPESIQDIAEALIYLDAESPAAADKLQADLMAAFEHLSAWPETGHSRSDLTSQPVRFWKSGPYLIVYRVANRIVQIVAVLHASRDIPEILAQR
jgi:plasmid stabilization system protein ParE